jgi:ketosteroid isomerase-like protein
VQVTTDKQSAVAQAFFQRLFRGDIATAVEDLDPKVTYKVPGSHQLAGTFKGPEAVAGHVQNLLRETHNTLDVIQWEDWMIGENDLAGLVRFRVQRNRAISTFRAIFLVTMSSDDKISSIEVFFDNQAEVERFFA